MQFRRELHKLLQKLLDAFPDYRTTGMLNTGHDLEEFEQDLEDREKAIQRIEKRTDKWHRKKKQYLEKAAQAKNQRRMRYVAKAKEAEMHKSFFRELFNNLMAQQLFLTKLTLEGKRRKLFSDPMGEFGFAIDIPDLDAAAIGDALDRSEIKSDELEQTMDDVTIHLESGDESSNLMPDLSELREEAEMLTASDLDDEDSVDLGSQWDDAFEDQIQAELDGMEDSYNHRGDDDDGSPPTPTTDGGD